MEYSKMAKSLNELTNRELDQLIANVLYLVKISNLN